MSTKKKTRRKQRRKKLGEATRRSSGDKGAAIKETKSESDADLPPLFLPGRQRTPVLGVGDPILCVQFCTGVACMSDEFLFDITEDKVYWNEDTFFQDHWERVWALGLAHTRPSWFWEEFWGEMDEELDLDDLGMIQEIDALVLGKELDELEVGDELLCAPFEVF